MSCNGILKNPCPACPIRTCPIKKFFNPHPQLFHVPLFSTWTFSQSLILAYVDSIPSTYGSFVSESLFLCPCVSVVLSPPTVAASSLLLRSCSSMPPWPPTLPARRMSCHSDALAAHSALSCCGPACVHLRYAMLHDAWTLRGSRQLLHAAR